MVHVFRIFFLHILFLLVLPRLLPPHVKQILDVCRIFLLHIIFLHLGILEGENIFLFMIIYSRRRRINLNRTYLLIL